jgi:putative ABC transport system permease protein
VTTLRPGRLSPADVLRLAAYGLRSRPFRVVLSALGIAIGIAAMVAVVGTSTSSRAQLNRLLGSLGTNLLTVAPGTTLFGEEATLPDESVVMIRRIRSVESVTAIGLLRDAKVYCTTRVPAVQSSGIGAYAVRTDLLDTVRGKVRSGIWLNAAAATRPWCWARSRPTGSASARFPEECRSGSAAACSPSSASSTRCRSRPSSTSAR